jgi:hypothetical protein
MIKLLFKHNFEINNICYSFSIVKYDKFQICGLTCLWNNNLISLNISFVINYIKKCNKDDKQIIEQAIFEYLV